jgi:predicted aspartyl protease
VTRFVSAFIAFLVAFFSIATGTGDAVAADCKPKRQAELAVVLLRNIPLVNLTVNGAPATFLLDTGAERTIMTAAAAQRLGVESHYEYPRRMRSLDGAVSSGDARLRSLGLGGTALADFRVLVGSVSLPGPTDKPLDGLLGADFFSSFEMDLDIAHSRLTLYERLPCAIAAPPWTLPYTTMSVNRSLHDHLFFPVSLDGHKLAAFIDTGAEVSALDIAAALALGVTGAALDHDPVANLRGAGSEVVKSRRHRFGRLEIGGETLRDQVIAVTNLRLQDADLVLGIDFLRSRRVWLSYGSHQIFFGHPT